jgi:hypothetical protein
VIELTKEERDKFAAWLEQEARSNDEMARNCEKVKGLSMEALAKKLKAEALAAVVVAKLLRRTEDLTINPTGH